MKKKAYILIKDLTVLFILMYVLWYNNEKQEQRDSNIESIKLSQDSINKSWRYVIDYHFESCDFTPKSGFIPFHSDNIN